MRAVSVHADLIVLISRFWQTTCTALRAGDEGFVIDSPVYPDELEAVAGVLEQAGFPVSGLLTTHADWDHLLGRIAFPQASLGCGESTAQRLAAEPGQAQRELRDFDEEHYVDDRGPLDARRDPVPARPRPPLARSRGSRARAPSRRTGTPPTAPRTSSPGSKPSCAATTSPRSRSRWISPGGSVEAYLETLARLRPLVERAQTIVPGHGRPLPSAATSALLEEDVAYLRALAAEGAGASLPAGRRTGAQQRIHAENVEATRRPS